MRDEGDVVVYDILRDGIGVAPVGVCLGMLLGLALGVCVFVSQRKRRTPVGGIAVWLILWTAGTIAGGGNVLYQHFRCVAWARSGAFQIVEGRVSQFHPSPSKRTESFVVKGITFSYSDANLGEGGFRYSFGPDGLLREGSDVRVSHREGRILKLEILK